MCGHYEGCGVCVDTMRDVECVDTMRDVECVRTLWEVRVSGHTRVGLALVDNRRWNVFGH